jgi:hypothetical protein
VEEDFLVGVENADTVISSRLECGICGLSLQCLVLPYCTPRLLAGYGLTVCESSLVTDSRRDVGMSGSEC